MAELRILFITGGSPWPPNIGAYQRTNLLYRSLRACGKVDTIIVSRYFDMTSAVQKQLEDEFGLVAHMKPLCSGQKWPWRIFWPFSENFACRIAYHLGDRARDYEPDPTLYKFLDERLKSHSYDVTVGRYLQPTACCGVFGHPRLHAPVILDVDDFDIQVLQTRMQSPGLSRLQKHSLKRALQQLKRIVPRLLDRCAHIWVTSENDQDLAGHRSASVLPNIPFLPADTSMPEPCPSCPKSLTILMVGSLAYPVNIRGISLFLNHVWPIIRRAHSRAEFRIVGYGMTNKERIRWGALKGVEPVGFVKNLKAEYERCAFTIVPLFEGGGTKIKILESLLYGRTCVVTAHSQRGYESLLSHLDSLWIANDETELAEGCIRLLREPRLRDKMARQGCHLVKRHYSFDRFQNVVKETVESVVSGNKGVYRRDYS